MPRPMKVSTAFEFGPRRAKGTLVGPLGVSAIVHLTIVLFLLKHAGKASTTALAPLQQPPSVEPIALPPLPPPAPRREPKPEEQTPPPPPTPPQQEVILGPDAKKPADVPKEATPPPAQTAPAPVEPTPPATQPAPTPKVAPEPEAPPAAGMHIPRVGELAGRSVVVPPQPSDVDGIRRSLAGPPAEVAAPSTAMGRRGLSRPDDAEWRPSFPEAAGQCVEIPDLGRNPDGSPVLATVLGRVYDSDHRTPLAGAYLQIVGTAYSTWTDGNGDYRLEFDPRLLERCRIQYVRVIADGHQNEMLMLAIGPKVRSDDVVMRRR